MLQKVEVEVTKEAYELGQALVEVVKSVKVALADGWQPGQDLPAILLASIAALPKGLEGVQNLPEESKELAPFIAAFGLAAKDIAGIFVVKA